MKQILQNLKNGETELVDIACPQVKPGHLLIRTKASVVSAGTEKMLVQFGQGNWINKARQQPEKVRQVMDKVRTDGLLPTLEAVKSKLDQPIPLGYSNSGEVIAVGEGVKEFQVGDRVVSNGYHAEIVQVPKNLCAKIPRNVRDDEAAFTVLGAVGLQGIRLIEPTLGESMVVSGLGVIGLLTVQLLKAQGCRVLGVDYDKNRLNLAKQLGVEVVNLGKGEDPVCAAHHFSRGRGVDGVLITASTKSSEPVHQAAQMCRKKGRIVLVGVTGLELSRADFYEKELSFQVSCSYGPGRYDQEYEGKGRDYPVGYVRWTEQRNFEAFLDMLSEGNLHIQPLISHRFSIDDAVEAYRLLSDKTHVKSQPPLGIVLTYPQTIAAGEELQQTTITLTDRELTNHEQVAEPPVSGIKVGLIGAGNYTNQVLIPALQKTGAHLKNIASSGGVSGFHVGRRYHFEKTTTNSEELIQDQEINTMFITTRHNTHAHFVKKGLLAGKHVFVEKPLCITRQELDEIKKVPMQNGQRLMVGFNRRFAPHIQKMKELLDTVSQPKTMIMTVNAGAIPSNHWTQDPQVGGGRIIGEACHFIDLLRFLAGHPVQDISAAMIGNTPDTDIREDKITFTLTFQDGSIGTVHYFANGHKSYPKEKLEVFAGGKILALHNFKVLKGYGWSSFKKMRLWRQDKGHSHGVKVFVDAIEKGLPAPISLEEIYEVTEATFDVLDAAKKR